MRQDSLVRDSGNGARAESPLWERYLDSRSIEDRNRLVLFHSPLVRHIAGDIARRTVQHSLDDLCSSGVLGLIDAVERFDPSDGYRFSTYATTRIKGAIIDEIRKNDPLPKRARAQVQRYLSARDEVEATMHRTPNMREIAEHLNTPVARIVQVNSFAVRGSSVASLSLLDMDNLSDRIDSPLEPDAALVRTSVREIVKRSLQSLTERQRQVLVLHYLEGFSKSEVANILQVDRSRVTQLIMQGLRNLKVLFDPSWNCDLDLN